MKSYYITFRSVTYAQQGEQILRRAGINCILMRTPRKMAMRGCGYSLRLRETVFPAAWERLQAARLPCGMIYKMDTDGTLEEVTI